MLTLLSVLCIPQGGRIYLQTVMSKSAAAASTLKLRCELVVLNSGTAFTTSVGQ